MPRFVVVDLLGHPSLCWRLHGLLLHLSNAFDAPNLKCMYSNLKFVATEFAVELSHMSALVVEVVGYR
jgi:hypothetical protein